MEIIRYASSCSLAAVVGLTGTLLVVNNRPAKAFSSTCRASVDLYDEFRKETLAISNLLLSPLIGGAFASESSERMNDLILNSFGGHVENAYNAYKRFSSSLIPCHLTLSFNKKPPSCAMFINALRDSMANQRDSLLLPLDKILNEPNKSNRFSMYMGLEARVYEINAETQKRFNTGKRLLAICAAS
jgi:hypothetical protein